MIRKRSKHAKSARVAVAAIALAATAVIAPATAQAEPLAPLTPPGGWGANSNGWQIDIVNHSSHNLTYQPRSTADLITSATPDIAAGGTGHVASKAVNGAPPVIDFGYLSDNGAGFVALGPDNDGDGMYATCYNYGATDVSCAFTQQVPNQPLQITFTNK